MTDSSRKRPLLICMSVVIRDYRKALSLSQEELAARSGLHRTHISDIERGTSENVAIRNVEERDCRVPGDSCFETGSTKW